MHEEEYLDILDEEGRQTGRTASYEEAHAKGLPHRGVQVWIQNGQGDILLQRRGASARAYPNHWDASAAGHVSAGETSLEAVRKETHEELGLDLSPGAFKYLFSMRTQDTLMNGTFIINDFQDVYAARIDAEHMHISPDAREVGEVRWVSLEEFSLWLQGEEEQIVPQPDGYKKLLDLLKPQV